MNMKVVYIALGLIALCQYVYAASQKKGFGIDASGFRCGDTWALTDASWWYDWRFDQGERHWHYCPNAGKPGYVPMIFNEALAHTAVIPQDAKYVLGFNEPNEPEQAGMTPERCAQVWPLVEQKAGNRILIGPALNDCDTDPDMCIQWYERFFKTCPNCRVDRIAIHGYHCLPYKMIDSITKISKHFKRKIWLTEFSCKGYVSVDDDMNFMRTLIPMLEKSPYVERYAWFDLRLANLTGYLPNRSTNLLEQDSSKLTRLGQLYNTLR